MPDSSEKLTYGECLPPKSKSIINNEAAKSVWSSLENKGQNMLYQLSLDANSMAIILLAKIGRVYK